MTITANDIHGIERGWTVKTADGHAAGSVEETTDTYILVKSGLVNAERRYLPAVTLEHVLPDMKEIRVSLTQAQLEEGDWSQVPTQPPRTEGAPLNAESDEQAEAIMGADVVNPAAEPERPVRL